MQQEMIAVKRDHGRMIASYDSYAAAQRAVDYLADRKFPVEHVAIVAEGLHFVEQVTGRIGFGSVLLNGILGGALTGASLGFLFGLFNFIAPLVSALNLAVYGLIFGAIVGAIIGLLSSALAGGRRDFSSVSGMIADRYHVMVDDAVADDAARVLAGMQDTAMR